MGVFRREFETVANTNLLPIINESVTRHEERVIERGGWVVYQLVE